MMIYKLSCITYRSDRYPNRLISPLTIGYYSSKEKAIEAMHQYIAQYGYTDKDDKYPNCLGFEIRKYAVDKTEFYYGMHIYCATYKHDGTFNDENLANEQGEFRGRPTEKVRFLPGEIVEVVHRNHARLGVVVVVPPSIERCSRLTVPDDRGRYCVLDDSDDQYTIAFPDSEFSHAHIESQFVFTPIKPISSSLRKKLMEHYSKYLNH